MSKYLSIFILFSFTTPAPVFAQDGTTATSTQRTEARPSLNIEHFGAVSDFDINSLNFNDPLSVIGHFSLYNGIENASPDFLYIMQMRFVEIFGAQVGETQVNTYHNKLGYLKFTLPNKLTLGQLLIQYPEADFFDQLDFLEMQRKALKNMKTIFDAPNPNPNVLFPDRRNFSSYAEEFLTKRDKILLTQPQAQQIEPIDYYPQHSLTLKNIGATADDTFFEVGRATLIDMPIADLLATLHSCGFLQLGQNPYYAVANSASPLCLKQVWTKLGEANYYLSAAVMMQFAAISNKAFENGMSLLRSARDKRGLKSFSYSQAQLLASQLSLAAANIFTQAVTRIVTLPEAKNCAAESYKSIVSKNSLLMATRGLTKAVGIGETMTLDAFNGAYCVALYHKLTSSLMMKEIYDNGFGSLVAGYASYGINAGIGMAIARTGRFASYGSYSFLKKLGLKRSLSLWVVRVSQNGIATLGQLVRSHPLNPWNLASFFILNAAVIKHFEPAYEIPLGIKHFRRNNINLSLDTQFANTNSGDPLPQCSSLSIVAQTNNANCLGVNNRYGGGFFSEPADNIMAIWNDLGKDTQFDSLIPPGAEQYAPTTYEDGKVLCSNDHDRSKCSKIPLVASLRTFDSYQNHFRNGFILGRFNESLQGWGQLWSRFHSDFMNAKFILQEFSKLREHVNTGKIASVENLLYAFHQQIQNIEGVLNGSQPPSPGVLASFYLPSDMSREEIIPALQKYKAELQQALFRIESEYKTIANPPSISFSQSALNYASQINQSSFNNGDTNIDSPIIYFSTNPHHQAQVYQTYYENKNFGGELSRYYYDLEIKLWPTRQMVRAVHELIKNEAPIHWKSKVPTISIITDMHVPDSGKGLNPVTESHGFKKIKQEIALFNQFMLANPVVDDESHDEYIRHTQNLSYHLIALRELSLNEITPQKTKVQTLLADAIFRFPYDGQVDLIQNIYAHQETPQANTHEDFNNAITAPPQTPATTNLHKVLHAPFVIDDYFDKVLTEALCFKRMEVSDTALHNRITLFDRIYGEFNYYKFTDEDMVSDQQLDIFNRYTTHTQGNVLKFKIPLISKFVNFCDRFVNLITSKTPSRIKLVNLPGLDRFSIKESLFKDTGKRLVWETGHSHIKSVDPAGRIVEMQKAVSSDNFFTRGLPEALIYDGNSIPAFMNSEASFIHWWNNHVVRQGETVVRGLREQYRAHVRDQLLNGLNTDYYDLLTKTQAHFYQKVASRSLQANLKTKGYETVLAPIVRSFSASGQPADSFVQGRDINSATAQAAGVYIQILGQMMAQRTLDMKKVNDEKVALEFEGKFTKNFFTENSTNESLSLAEYPLNRRDEVLVSNLMGQFQSNFAALLTSWTAPATSNPGQSQFARHKKQFSELVDKVKEVLFPLSQTPNVAYQGILNHPGDDLLEQHPADHVAADFAQYWPTITQIGTVEQKQKLAINTVSIHEVLELLKGLASDLQSLREINNGRNFAFDLFNE